MTLIDTSAWIEFLRRKGDPTVKQRVAAYLAEEQAAYCGPVEFELLSGARDAERADVEAALTFSTCLEFSRPCWRRAAELEQRLRLRGITIPRDDVFVAATAVHYRVALYACDAHFALLFKAGIRGLELA